MPIRSTHGFHETIRLGRIFSRRFFVLLKTAGHYPRGHPAMERPAADCRTTIDQIHRMREEASFSVSGNHLFSGESLLKPDAAGFEAFAYIVRVLSDLGVGTITFSPDVREGDLDEFAHLAQEVEHLGAEDPFGSLVHLMGKSGCREIDVERPPENVDLAEWDRDRKKRAKVMYAQTVDIVSDVMEDAKLGKTLRMRRSKRIVQKLIDTMLAAETNLLGLTTIRCHDEYTYNHSVNVGILSLALGQRMNLKRHTLVDLGMAAIFHDIGKSCIPLEILNKPTSFTKEEWRVMKRHPVLGVKELLRLKGVDALSARIMVGAFEHHLYYDLSGYPKVPYGKPVSLSGRIISIADFYDAVSSSRVYSRKAAPPDKTLQFMFSRSGTYYDPVLVKLFVNCVGVYPIGSLCRLTTGELAVVMENNPTPEKWQVPVVLVISNSTGREVSGRRIDLSAAREKRKIAGTVDAEKFGIDVARYFL